MKIIEKKLEDIRPYDNNPRINDEAVPFVAESLKKFGWQQPIVIDRNDVIVCGHTRYKAALELGMKTAPCKYADELTEEEITAYRLADNKTAELAEWDADKMEEELAKCSEFDMSAFGFMTWFDEHETGEATEEDSDEYKDFVEKFEEKHTTDDCYTPDEVYQAVSDYVEEHYGMKTSDFVRPFYPGGDYQSAKYPKGCVVVDNPPFSIMKEIIDFYNDNGVRFFLFCPSLAAFDYCDRAEAVALQCCVEYENGAKVPTSFLTNLEEGYAARSDPELYKAIDTAAKAYSKSKHKEIPKYSYPVEVMTAAKLGYLSKYGQSLRISRRESVKIRKLDSQEGTGKAIYGSGLLLSERAAAERAAAERAAAERAAATAWPLSEREREIVRGLGK